MQHEKRPAAFSREVANVKGPFKASYRRTTGDVKTPILAYFNAHPHRPVLIGQIATELKCSLSDAEAYLADLCDEGVVRELASQEALKFGVRHGYVKIQK